MKWIELESFCGDICLWLQRAFDCYIGQDSRGNEIRRITFDELRKFDGFMEKEPDLVIGELEANLVCTKEHDLNVFGVWRKTFSLLFAPIDDRQRAFLNMVAENPDSYSYENDTKFNPRIYAFKILCAAKWKMKLLEDGISLLMKTYGINADTSFISAVCDGTENYDDSTSSLRHSCGRPSASANSFHEYVCDGYSVDSVHEELCNSLNGKKGKAAADIIIKYMKEGKLKKKVIPFKVMQKAFGVVGSHQAYNQAFSSNGYKRDPISGDLIF